MTVNNEISVESVSNQEKINNPEPIVNNDSQKQLPMPTQLETEDPNWRAFREARKKDRAEKEEAQRRLAEKEAEAQALKAAMEAAFSKSPQVNQQQNNNYYNENEESEDERIEKKVQAAILAREQQYERERIEREQREYPQRLVKDHPDFNNVISQENLDYLDYHYPEISRPLQRLRDDYDKWNDIYYAIKKLIPNQGNAKKEAARADANFNKPKSISSPALTQSGGESYGSAKLSEERKKANWERMQKMLRSVG